MYLHNIFWNKNETINTIKIFHINATKMPTLKAIKSCLNNLPLWHLFGKTYVPKMNEFQNIQTKEMENIQTLDHIFSPFLIQRAKGERKKIQCLES